MQDSVRSASGVLPWAEPAPKPGQKCVHSLKRMLEISIAAPTIMKSLELARRPITQTTLPASDRQIGVPSLNREKQSCRSVKSWRRRGVFSAIRAKVAAAQIEEPMGFPSIHGSGSRCKDQGFVCRSLLTWNHTQLQVSLIFVFKGRIHISI